MTLGPVYDDTLAMLIADALDAYSTMLALERGRRGEHMLELARDASELAAQVKACDASELARVVRTPACNPASSVALHYQAAPVTLTSDSSLSVKAALAAIEADAGPDPEKVLDLALALARDDAETATLTQEQVDECNAWAASFTRDHVIQPPAPEKGTAP
jgi:hypothetical protein